MGYKRNSVQLEELVKGRKYYFDDYTTSTGFFDKVIEDNNQIRVLFTPFSSGNYSVSNGFVGFRIAKGENLEFYKTNNA